MIPAKLTLCTKASLLGIGVIAVGAGIAWVSFGPEPYSIFNHFVSELGWGRYSPRAWAFNNGLIIGGALLAPGTWHSIRRLNSRIATWAAGASVVTAMGISAVGAIPMDRLPPHLAAAMLFFSSLLLQSVLFAIASWPHRQLPGHRLACISSIITASLAAALLLYPKASFIAAMQHWEQFQRPTVWPLACIEWALVTSAIGWIFIVSLSTRSEEPNQEIFNDE